MKLLCKALGGSHSYGLNTPESDIDWRGVFIHTEPKYILGLGINAGEHVQDKSDGKDDEYKELRHVFSLLRNSNSQMIELLFNENWELITDYWKEIQKNKHFLINSDGLFNCLRGYSQGELKLANGERTGKLGGKRKAALDKYGFSPKNFVQLFRLNWAGAIFFQKGYFPVNVAKEDQKFAYLLLNIKTKPETWGKDMLNQMAKNYEEELKKAYDNRQVSFEFNEELANKLCYDFYLPILLTKENLCKD